jgi:UDP-3-O-[3-hydroxymyristoyl] glucosamine N-acyltransferase
MRATLGEIAAALGVELSGPADAAERPIEGLGPLESADARTVAFLANPRYRAQLAASVAACVIVAPVLREAALARVGGRGAALVTEDPYLCFARLTQWWARRVRPLPTPGVHATAVVSADAVLAGDVSVGPYAVIESGAVLEPGVVVGAHSFVGRHVRIGAGSQLAPRATVHFDCVLGARCLVHSGAVIGADGFGFAPTQSGYVKIEQLGAVRIGDDVEIGANTCIDRGALEDTLIGHGVKLDNLVQIAHNVQIGEHTAIAGGVGIAGSAKIGARCTIGGKAGVAGHLEIGNDVHIGAHATVMSSVTDPGIYSGYFPLDEARSFQRNAAVVRQLQKMRERLRALEKQIDGRSDVATGPDNDNEAT